MRTTSGFSFIELIVVIGVFAILVGIASVSLLGAQRRPVLTSSVDSLVADIRQQQGKAMNGLGSRGVYFEPHDYVLFSGASYVSGSLSNSVVSLDPNIAIVTGLTASQLVFASGSGEVVGYFASNNTVSLFQTLNNEEKSIQFNRYGVVANIY